ncbi:MAG: hypothetical protein M3Y41_04630, partial [Pseudomonadota bacterium]|nr:hypothetical protein [Pseudomonadota bacterium]
MGNYPIEEIYNIHYPRKTNFDGYVIFAEPDSYRDFLSKDLKGVEEVLQRHVRKIWGEMPPHLQARR